MAAFSTVQFLLTDLLRTIIEDDPKDLRPHSIQHPLRSIASYLLDAIPGGSTVVPDFCDAVDLQTKIDDSLREISVLAIVALLSDSPQFDSKCAICLVEFASCDSESSATCSLGPADQRGILMPLELEEARTRYPRLEAARSVHWFVKEETRFNEPGCRYPAS